MSHRHVERQLRRLGLTLNEPPDLGAWQSFVSSLELAFEETDCERSVLQQSTSTISRQMSALNDRLQRERDQFVHTFDAAPVGMATLDPERRIDTINNQMARLVDRPAADLLTQPLKLLVHESDLAALEQSMLELVSSRRDVLSGTFHLQHRDGHPVDAKYGLAVVRGHCDRSCRFVLVVEDISERSRLEVELRHAQRLESVGRLAAGIAHEINTPIQFIGDNVNFLRDVVADIVPLVETFRRYCQQARTALLSDEDWQILRAAEEEADLDFATENLPRSVEATLNGVRRVARIVQSMKNFAHPDRGEKTTVDLNAAIQSTLVVANAELKYVANVETDLGTLPLVPCYLGDLNQVVLNLLINAAHAIEETVDGHEEKGTISVRTRARGAGVTIDVSDTGAGIPREIQAKIFDPFFTTKEVGKGTGQGLALARSVVEKHGGKLSFATEVGKGTTFTIWLPLLQEAAVEARDSFGST